MFGRATITLGIGQDMRRDQTVDMLKVTQQGAARVRCGCQLGCSRWGAHWHNLVSTIEWSMCSLVSDYFDRL